jgi:hypothetical protein
VKSEFDDCDFEGCHADSWGGGIYAEFFGLQNFSRCIFKDCSADTVF